MVRAMAGDLPGDTTGDTTGETGHLADNIVYFARALRKAGLKLGPGSVADAIEAATVAGIGSREDFYWTLHGVLVKRHEDSVVFVEVFRIYWRSRGLMEKMLAIMSPSAPPQPREEEKRAGATRASDALMERKREEAPQRDEIDIDARLSVSGREILRRKDFAQMTASELAEARKAMRDVVLPDDHIVTRRFINDRSGRRLDPRRMMRASLSNGGDLILPRFRSRKKVQPPLVVIADISGSMSQYSRTFLHFLHALTEKRRRVHSFVFGTRLTNITRALRHRDVDEALAECAISVEDWSGGTRIGAALHRFNRLWSRRVLAQGATVLLITDGLERDEVDELSREMERLHHSCRRLIWLNPLLRFEGFEPRARGIRAIMPHVDDFRPVHNLEALADLGRALSSERG